MTIYVSLSFSFHMDFLSTLVPMMTVMYVVTSSNLGTLSLLAEGPTLNQCPESPVKADFAHRATTSFTAN